MNGVYANMFKKDETRSLNIVYSGGKLTVIGFESIRHHNKCRSAYFQNITER